MDTLRTLDGRGGRLKLSMKPGKKEFISLCKAESAPKTGNVKGSFARAFRGILACVLACTLIGSLIMNLKSVKPLWIC
ncbi:hypothetical protein D3C87_1670550 [compost metagenome]